MLRRGFGDSRDFGEPFVKREIIWLLGMLLLANIIWFASVEIAAQALASARKQWLTTLITLGITLSILIALAITLYYRAAEFRHILLILDVLGGTIESATWLVKFLAPIPAVTCVLFPPILASLAVICRAAITKQPLLNLMARGMPTVTLVLLIGYMCLVFTTANAETRQIARSNYRSNMKVLTLPGKSASNGRNSAAHKPRFQINRVFCS